MVKDGCEVTKEQADQFGQELSDLISQRLRDRLTTAERKFTLRMSNIGKGARQLWYDSRYGNEEDLTPNTLIKFMFGDIIEQLTLFLAGLGGEIVTEKQAEVHVDGIKGHIDADINGVTVDVKSASTHAFRKFNLPKEDPQGLVQNDAFGYVEQLAGYCEARDTPGAFLAVDKQNGHVAYLEFDKEELAAFKVRDRIAYIKDVVDADVEPERCHSDVEEGKSGNRALGINCSYCNHKSRCWADSNGGLGLRIFSYASGPKFLTKVVKEPNVYEISPF